MRTFSLNLWIFRFRLYFMRYKLTVGKNSFFPAHSSRFGSTPCDFPSSLHSLGVKTSNWASLSVSDTCECWLQCPEHIPQFLDDSGRLYSFGIALNMIWIKLLFIKHLNMFGALLLLWILHHIRYLFGWLSNILHHSFELNPLLSHSKYRTSHDQWSLDCSTWRDVLYQS